MFPLYDSEKPGKIPYVNYLIIIITIGVFLVELSRPDPDMFIHTWGFIPALFADTEKRSYLYIITSLFLHGSLLHLGMNLWFLHIFGDNVEDTLGHIGYLLFYLAAGIVATLAQYTFIKHTNIPLIGASGAISGVAGFYLVYQMRSTIVTLVPLGVFLTTARLPSWIFLGIWLVLQFVQGTASLGRVNYNLDGIAWFAHLGGFFFGLAIGLILRPFLHKR